MKQDRSIYAGFNIFSLMPIRVGGTSFEKGRPAVEEVQASIIAVINGQTAAGVPKGVASVALSPYADCVYYFQNGCK